MITECRKALLKSWIGVALVFSSLGLVYVFRADFSLAMLIVFLILGIGGLLLVPCYLRCVKKLMATGTFTK